MTEWLNEFFQHLTSVAVAVGIVIGVGKLFFGHLLKADLEQMKLELKQQLETESKSDERVRREIVAWANPIQDAALSLERRLDNILNYEGHKALTAGFTNPEWSITHDYFVQSTLYEFARYFCWVQMLRLELSFEMFRSLKEKSDLFEKIDAVSQALGDYDPPLYMGTGHDTQVFRLQQQAIGELLAVRRSGKRACLGYAQFLAKLTDPQYQAALAPLHRLVDGLQSGEKRFERLKATHGAADKLVAQCEETLKLRSADPKA